MWSWIPYSLKIGAFQDMIVFPSTKNRYILLKEKRVDIFSKAIKTIAFISFFKVLLAPVLFTPPPTESLYLYKTIYRRNRNDRWFYFCQMYIVFCNRREWFYSKALHTLRMCIKTTCFRKFINPKDKRKMERRLIKRISYKTIYPGAFSKCTLLSKARTYL